MEQTLIQAVLLGVMEGLTEFLPVSSTGHLILLVDIIGFAAVPGQVFEIVIQLGAILAICWLYKHKLFSVAANLHICPVARNFARNILLSFMPAAILGALFHEQIKLLLFSPSIVAIMLIFGGIVILIVERLPLTASIQNVDSVSWKTALLIGCCQAIAMIPGTSRSGATIMGGLILGMDRKTATEYSFFLAIPTMFGAVCYDLYKNWHMLSNNDTAWLLIAIGFMTAFCSALLVVSWLIAFISKHGFVLFAYYRILLGSIILLVGV